jgi:hypothetical protein
VILSPQSTPWHKYSGEAGNKLELAKELVKDFALQEKCQYSAFAAAISSWP